MTAQIRRAIVIEFEKVQAIRKRAKTSLAFCVHCRIDVDAVPLIEAAELFETALEDLFQFTRQNECHYHVGGDDIIYLCVPSLIERMQQKNQTRQLMAKGE